MKPIILISLTAIACGVLIMMFYNRPAHAKPLFQIDSPTDVAALFPTTVSEIKERTDKAIEALKAERAAFLAIPAEQRTFENTVQALDHMLSQSDLALLMSLSPKLKDLYSIWRVVEMIYPDKAMRDAAQEQVVRASSFFLDEFYMSEQVYNAWKDYLAHQGARESLTESQTYFIQLISHAFEQNGLNLPAEQREKLKTLQKELTKTCLEFSAAIAQSIPTISVSPAELDGLQPDFIANLKRDKEGNCIVGIDSPTAIPIMAQCHNQKTRKRLWEISVNRAYPENKTRLEKMIALRDEIARTLGHPSYASFELSDQMVKSVERAEQFLDALIMPAREKAVKELATRLALDVKNITRRADGKILPWDGAYLKDQYKKQVFAFDEEKVAAYFPMEQTIAGLFDIYQTFFNLKLQTIPYTCSWSPDVTMLAVYDGPTSELLGYLLLDLYPRENKYNHACQTTLVPSTFYANGKPNTVVAMVIANFPKATPEKPALLKYHDVSTFFHEFGHALHAILGRTHQAIFCGTETKRDFVELPSQILEEWLYDRAILKKVSHHYQTGESMPDALIDALIGLKKFDSGSMVAGQSYLALLSLYCFKEDAVKDIDLLRKELYERTCPMLVFMPESHSYASFGHLTEYGSQYYGYLWSKVFALDIFEQIKKEGLLNPEVGRRYAQTILAPGGSKDPNEMLKEFLGREPNQEAFLRDLGLDGVKAEPSVIAMNAAVAQ